MPVKTTVYQHKNSNIYMYKKAGDFSHAMEDFMSVVPENNLLKRRDALNVSTIITIAYAISRLY